LAIVVAMAGQSMAPKTTRNPFPCSGGKKRSLECKGQKVARKQSRHKRTSLIKKKGPLR